MSVRGGAFAVLLRLPFADRTSVQEAQSHRGHQGQDARGDHGYDKAGDRHRKDRNEYVDLEDLSEENPTEPLGKPTEKIYLVRVVPDSSEPFATELMAQPPAHGDACEREEQVAESPVTRTEGEAQHR